MKKLALLILIFTGFIHFLSAQDVKRVEYFYDTDPGFGQGISLPIVPKADIDTSLIFDMSGLENGSHTLFVRALSDSGWSVCYSKSVIVECNPAGAPRSDVFYAEYFIGPDPGHGNATPLLISPDSIAEVVDTLDFTGFSPGMHMLHFRAKDSYGSWSVTYSRPVLIVNGSNAPLITAMEYFYDADPGFGNGIQVAFPQDTIIDTNFVFQMSGLSPGLHFLNVRASDSSGTWSMTYMYPVMLLGNIAHANIVALEYFVDNDPGFGSGVALPLSPDSLVEVMDTLDLSGFSSGLHMLHIRAKDENNNWSQTYPRPVLVVKSSDAPMITKIEYFLDDEPGFGNGVTVPLSPATVIDTALSFDLSGLPTGLHFLNVRAADSSGTWSHTYMYPLMLKGSMILADIISIEYFVDNDPGFGNGNSLPLSPDSLVEAIDTLDLSSFSTGMHILHLRAKDANGNWSQTFTRPFLKVGNGIESDISRIEYFVDTDPGFGNGVPISITAAPELDEEFNYALDSASEGLHRIFVRAMNSNGTWSITNVREFCVGPQAFVVVPKTCLGDSTFFINLSDTMFANTVYEWDIDGDGIVDTTASGNVAYVFDTAGSYHSTLVVYNDLSCPDTIIVDFDIDPLAISDFEAIPDTIGNGASFINHSQPFETGFWDFGDGFFTNESEPQHVFDEAGYFYVCLTVIDTSTVCPSQDKSCKIVLVGGDTMDCFARFTYNNVSAAQIEFDPAVSMGAVAQWYWNFGDGDISLEQQPQHTFDANGYFNVTLTIIDSSGCSDDYTATIIVGSGVDCEADYLYWSELSSDTVYFLEYATGDSLDTYIWNFGDDSVYIGQEPMHVYESSGYYEVCLTVMSSYTGCRNISCKTIIAGDSASCLADFSFVPDTTALSVAFSDQSRGGPNAWRWNFGDSITSSEQHPQHTYSEAGLYLVLFEMETPACADSRLALVNMSGDFSNIFGNFIFSVDTTSKSEQYPADFKGTAFGDPAVISWDFGDGGVDSTSFDPYHVYQDTGMYMICFTVEDPLTGQSYEVCKALHIEGPTGATALQYPIVWMQLFPNPVTDDKVTIRLLAETNGKAEISVYNMNGETVLKSIAMFQSGENLIPLRMESLPAGIYSVRLQSEAMTITGKLSVVR
ncbi:MAG: PKD domain-containing protein [Bacteroidetes bacterium]|nr:PKD domain-containing protein [Bacteroidota bacterium]MBU1718486.1 PKD domain-containing protein [Bacteroidota bacterium]